MGTPFAVLTYSIGRVQLGLIPSTGRFNAWLRVHAERNAINANALAMIEWIDLFIIVMLFIGLTSM